MLAILAAVMLAATTQHDTVFLNDGGRVVGTVVEEGAKGVSVQLADGTFRHFERREVARIQYADGTVSTLNAGAPPSSPAAPGPAPTPPPSGAAQAPSYTPPPPPSYTPPPPPSYAPPYGPSPYRAVVVPRGAPISPFYLSFGFGAAIPTGLAEHVSRGDIHMSDVFDPEFDFQFEGGFRVTPHVALGLYGGFGIGDPARDIRNQCNDAGFICDASISHFGVLVRYTFKPRAPITPWISAGTGWERAGVSESDTGVEQFHYSGWEFLRLQGGVDFRSTPFFGWGFYAGVGLGRFSRYEDLLVAQNISDQRVNAIVQGGIRLTLFP